MGGPVRLGVPLFACKPSGSLASGILIRWALELLDLRPRLDPVRAAY